VLLTADVDARVFDGYMLRESTVKNRLLQWLYIKVMGQKRSGSRIWQNIWRFGKS